MKLVSTGTWMGYMQTGTASTGRGAQFLTGEERKQDQNGPSLFDTPEQKSVVVGSFKKAPHTPHRWLRTDGYSFRRGLDFCFVLFCLAAEWPAPDSLTQCLG